MGNGALLVGGLAALWVLSKVNTGNSLTFIPVGANWDGRSLQISIGVQNPTSNSLQFNSLAGYIFVNGNNAGNISSFQPTTIMPNGQTNVQIAFTPNYATGVTALLNTLFGFVKTGNITISIKGTANVNSFNLPVNMTFQPIAI
jgi:LEA14-like dessication related protein